jgi:uncharacterized protein YqgC (DUF456 family)
MSTATAVAAVLIAFGLVGVLLPILPGLLLVWLGIAFWAYRQSSPGGWLTLSVATVILAIGLIVKYVIPGRRLREAGVPWITLVTGGVLGVIGFFIIPILGLPIGFVAGVYLAETIRNKSAAAAWPTTRGALTAIGVSMIIELGTGLLAATIWAVGVLIT